MKLLIRCSCLLALSAVSLQAVTSQLSSSVYSVTEGVAFKIANSGISHFSFSWTDSNGTFGNYFDPTLVLRAGQTYTFERTSSSHPFFIADDSLPITGSDGSYSRNTFDTTVINNSILGGPDDLNTFVAYPNSGSSVDLITWTPTSAEQGTYYYSCYITGHPNMSGSIQVVPEPATVGLLLSGAVLLFTALRRRK